MQIKLLNMQKYILKILKYTINKFIFDVIIEF